MTDIYAESLREIGFLNPETVVINVDTGFAMQTHLFKKEFPSRTLEMGIAEQNAVGAAIGLALEGFVSLVHGYSPFLIRRAFDQLAGSIMQGPIGVKLIGGSFGFSSGPAGRSHHAIADIAALRALHNMVILEPCDKSEVAGAIKAAVGYDGPVYIRLRRDTPPGFSIENDLAFNIGKGKILRSGNDLTLIGAGTMTEILLQAADLLENENIHSELVHLPTLWPLDSELILRSVKGREVVVVAENHSIHGGVGGAVSELLSANGGKRVLNLGIDEGIYSAGSRDYFLNKFQLKPEQVASRVKKILNA